MGNDCFLRLKICFAGLIALLSYSGLVHSSNNTQYADALFAFESADLNHVAKQQLENLVAKGDLVNPDFLAVFGHSARGETNGHVLSVRRALAVKFYLLQLGVPPARVFTEGKGSSQLMSDREQSANRRAEIEFVGIPVARAEIAGNSFINLWDVSSGRVSLDAPEDQWSGVTPLRFLPQVADKRLRNKFLRKLQPVAIRNKDDGYLRVLWSLKGAGSIPADEYVSPALYANVFGTPYARQLLSGELARLPADDPTRLRFGQRLWCDGLRFESLATVIQSVLPALTSIAQTPPNEQFGWLSCAADRANEADILWLIQLGVSVNVADSTGRTALHRAVLNHNPNGMKALIATGANPNLRDGDGSTPLHRVAQSSGPVMFPVSPAMRRRLWDILVEGGADPSMADQSGRLPVVPAAPSLR
jgi:hypothetical protein